MTNILFYQWLSETIEGAEFAVAPLAGDASFRLYFRVTQGDQTWVAMDASAEKEKCSQFIAIAEALRKQNLCVPEILAQDLSAGFLLLTDFGDEVLLKKLNADNAENLYGVVLESLASLSTCRNYSAPPFTAEFMREEMNWFQEWFLEKHLHCDLSAETKIMLATTFDTLVKECAAQPYVFMHRDFHSANLMLLPKSQIGILDFQDAFMGPVTYDLASLLRDCYIDWPETLVTKLALHYKKIIALDVSDTEFLRWFDWIGMQRHLKALLTFARKYRRDHNDNYLQHIPRTLHYILRISVRYPEFNALHVFLKDQVWEQLACVP